tara:strand:- start:2303 stop:2845 length:543 start_codon:yes stop_codon:yes gene_type:complete
MLKINYRKPAELIPYISNSRTHSEQQIQQVASSIKEFGFTNPILVDEESGIIAGHGRLQAAQLLGLDKVPTIKLEGLTESQRKAYVIADNKLALNAGWDFELLKIEIQDIADDFDLSLLGFDDQELSNIIDGLNEESPELKEESYSPVFNIVVNCNDETHQEKVYNELQSKGYECQVQSL